MFVLFGLYSSLMISSMHCVFHVWHDNLFMGLLTYTKQQQQQLDKHRNSGRKKISKNKLFAVDVLTARILALTLCMRCHTINRRYKLSLIHDSTFKFDVDIALFAVLSSPFSSSPRFASNSELSFDYFEWGGCEPSKAKAKANKPQPQRVYRLAKGGGRRPEVRVTKATSKWSK